MYIYEQGKRSGFPRASDPVFTPTFDGSRLHKLYEYSSNGVVRVGSPGMNFPYVFQVESFDELVLAYIYITVKDNVTHGTYTKAARDGKLVYTHGMYDRVKRWWALPDKIKYRGYRLDV